MLNKFSSTLSDSGFNIEHMINKSKKDYAYTLIDVAGDISDDIIEKMKSGDVMRIRVIK